MNPQALRNLFWGGLLPIIAFTVIEAKYGAVWGVVAGMIFGSGEILWEKFRQGKVSAITWGVNALILVLGGLSIWAQDGIWFKLQPALVEAIFALALFVSVIAGKPLPELMAAKQGREFPPQVRPLLRGMTIRLGCFFVLHAVLATWAAFAWSTTAWALLKGVGLMVSLVLYSVAEGLWLRKRVRASL